MSAVFWKIHKFGVFEAKHTFKLFYDCFASSEFAFKIQANANQAAICLLSKSKAHWRAKTSLGCKPDKARHAVPRKKLLLSNKSGML